MRCPWWPALILAGSIVGVTLGAGEPDALEHNRHLLERWRADPDHAARLARDLRAFYALPLPRQQQMRLLDEQLYAADGPTRTRLMAVLERYNAWLDALPEEQRRSILDAPDAATRLARVRELRLRDWLPRLPTPEQQAVRLLPAEQQPDRIAAFRYEERRQRTVWQRDWVTHLASIPKPTRTSELPPATKAFVEANVLRHLTHDEREGLKRLEGKYPEWPRQLLLLSERHRVLPPGPHGEITSLEQLSRIKGYERFAKKSKVILRIKGRWPEFALAIHKKYPSLPPLGASKLEDLPNEAQIFVRRDLYPVISNEQRTRLETTRTWPEYPDMLHSLARQKRLVIPGMSLPGPVEMWENVRTTVP